MKIAIMTQPLGSNYGGIIQAYALQKILRDLGHDVVTIDRQHNKRSFVIRSLRPFKSTIYKILGRKVTRKLSSEQNKYIHSGMTDFIDRYIQLSKPINSNASMKSHYQKANYDLVVVGSDQVWRPKYSPSIYNFFMDFIKEEDKSIAYAASFGTDEWEFDKAQTKHCKDLIKRFDAISVREISAVRLCKEKLGVDAQLVLDPTMLITGDEYGKLLPNRKPQEEGRILRYILDDSKNNNDIINQVATQLDKLIFTAQPARKLTDTNSDNMDEYKYPCVEEWIMSFRDADFVVTDSFHGCVFSIIFNKPFIAIGNKERGLGRFESLLTIFGLSDRLVLDNNIDIQALVKKEIDWKEVNFRLIEYKAASMSFLKRSIVIN